VNWIIRMYIMSTPTTPDVKVVTAKAAKQAFGQLLIDAQHEPIRIDRNGRPIAYVVSMPEFERLSAIRELMLRQEREGEAAPLPDPQSGTGTSSAGGEVAAAGPEHEASSEG
jgi:prevent-host-death family protein